MKSAKQILAEIDRVIQMREHCAFAMQDPEEISIDAGALEALREIKRFILSGDECEHEWPKETYVFEGSVFFTCLQCNKRIEMKKLYPS